MIQKRKLLHPLLIALILVGSGGLMLQQIDGERQKNSETTWNPVIRSIMQEYTLHSPIAINNDTELAAITTFGNGSVNNPYIITGWNISDSPSYGIYITGTTKHFSIENCWIDSSNEHGIQMDDVATGTTTIVNNTCNNNNDSGIRLYRSGSSTIVNNTSNDNGGTGISLIFSSNSTVVNNTCYNNSAGIRLYRSGSSTIINNTFFNNALNLEEFSKEEFLSYTVENNTVNELPLGYLENITDSTINKTYGQLILINCNNTIVKNQNCSNILTGIALYYCYENLLVNNTCNTNNWSGIYLFNSGFSTIANNTCNTNSQYGIFLFYSSFSTTTNNTCNDNSGHGILVFNSKSSSLTNNTCNNNSFHGIYLSVSSSSSIINNSLSNSGLYFEASSKEEFLSYTIENNTINKLPLGYFENLTYSTITKTYGQLILINCNNTLVENQNYSNTSIGIALYYSYGSQLVNNICNTNNWHGIYLHNSGSSTITANTCNNNNWNGIHLLYSGSSTITDNICNNNTLYGIYLFSSSTLTMSNNDCNDNGRSDIYIFIYVGTTTTIINPLTSEPETSISSTSEPEIGESFLTVFIRVAIFGVIVIFLFIIRSKFKTN